IVYKALGHARLTQLGLIEPAKDWNDHVGDEDAFPDEPRVRPGVDPEVVTSFNRDLPHPFALSQFVEHIVGAQGVVFSAQKKKWTRRSPSDFKSHRSILDKLNVLRTDPRLRFMMKEKSDGDPELSEIIEQFVGDSGADRQQDIRVIDISGLPNEVAGP